VVRSRIRLVLLAGALGISSLSGCRDIGGGQAQASGGVVAPELLVFVYDRSSSIQDHELAHARALTRERLRHLDHGDRFVALEILELSLAEEPRRWSQQVPQREFTNQEVARDSIARARFIQDAVEYIQTFSSAEGRDAILGTDILSTLHLVAAELAAYPGHRPTVVLFSDMLQANALMNMEGMIRMPSANWAQAQASLGTLPDLSGLCVFVVGALNDDRPGQIVQAFWEDYFKATGATLHPHNYSYRPVQIPHRPCPGL
jgi:hypothetical protein